MTFISNMFETLIIFGIVWLLIFYFFIPLIRAVVGVIRRRNKL